MRPGAVAPAASAAKYVGVYTATNGTPNKVVVFEPGCTPPPGCPILDANSEVNVSPNGRLVFAVNAR